MTKILTLSLLANALLLTACVSNTNNNEIVSATTNAKEAVESTILGNSLPQYAFEMPELSNESNDEVHSLVKEASQNVYDSPRQARKSYVKALALVKAGKAIDKYDYLWTRYGLLKSSFETATADFGPGTLSDFITMAKQTLDYLNQATSTGMWEFTDLGAFQKESYREAGNGLAWYQMESAKTTQELETALNNVEYAVNYVENPEHYFILDTKVRILLKLQREEEAFKIVRKVLDEVPDFDDFQDFPSNKAYQQWLSK